VKNGNVTNGFLQAGKVNLEWQCYGDPSQQITLVLLHEGLGCVELWRDFPEQLAEHTGFAVLVYSRAGYGRSDTASLPRPADYMTIEAQQVVPEVLRAAGVSRCVLVGHSDGATIASIYAGTMQDFRVRGVVLIAPHFFAEQISIEAIARAGDEYRNGGLKQKLARYHDNVDAAFYGWHDAWLSDEFKHWNVSEVIDYFRVPVLGIQSVDDQYGTLAQLHEIRSRCYSPFDELLLNNCGHSPHIEQPQQTLESIAGFCERLTSIGAFD
jgi:pimeloyl-ACP methyl ester carboxylesterase